MWLGLWSGVTWGSMALIRAGMAWRSWLYWSNIACDGASVAADGDGEGVERSLTGLVAAGAGCGVMLIVGALWASMAVVWWSIVNYWLSDWRRAGSCWRVCM